MKTLIETPEEKRTGSGALICGDCGFMGISLDWVNWCSIFDSVLHREQSMDGTKTIIRCLDCVAASEKAESIIKYIKERENDSGNNV